MSLTPFTKWTDGDISFAPQIDGHYIVRGELKPDHSALWIEDEATKQQQGDKLLVRGSTAMNSGTLMLLGPVAAKSSKPVERVPPP